MTTAKPNVADSSLSLSITRTFDASPERVFNAWLDAEQFGKWMGPKVDVSECEILKAEPRVGGQYRIRMRKLADGEDLYVGGVYRRIDRFSCLSFTWSWDQPSSCSGEDMNESDVGTEALITLTFNPVNGGKQTEFTLLHENFPSVEARDSHNHGWNACADQLAEYLAK